MIKYKIFETSTEYCNTDFDRTRSCSPEKNFNKWSEETNYKIYAIQSFRDEWNC